MKLKPVVASLVMLGLMTPAFGVGGSKALSQQAVVDQNSVISPLCGEGWFNRIQIGGVGSINAITGNRDPAGMFTNLNSSSDIYVNNFNLLVNANLSSWSKATLNMAYLGAPIPWGNMYDLDNNNFKSTHVISNQILADEAYITIGNFAKNPFYLIVGKKFVPFGDYTDPHVPYQLMSPAQMLTQTNAVTAIAGVSTDFGPYASIFAFKGDTSPMGSTANNIRNFGVKLGYYSDLDHFSMPDAHLNIALGYMHNIWDTQYFSPNPVSGFWGQSVSGFYKLGHPANIDATTVGYNIDPIGGISAHADFEYKALSVSANFASAVKKMVNSTYSPNKYDSSRFWGADVKATYSFKTLDRNSSLGPCIQWSGNGAWMGNYDNGKTNGVSDWVMITPKWRLVGEYNIELFKNTNLALSVAHGKSYDFHPYVDNNNVASFNSTVGLARLMVKL